MKVRVQSLISTKAHKKTRVAIGSNRENAGFACRGVGHTARGREMPRELHLTDVRLLYLISPRVSKGHRFPAFWCAAAWCDVRLTHKRSCVGKRIWTSVHEREAVRGIVLYILFCDLVARSDFRSGTTADNRSLHQICHFRRRYEMGMATVFQKKPLALILGFHSMIIGRYISSRPTNHSVLSQ